MKQIFYRIIYRALIWYVSFLKKRRLQKALKRIKQSHDKRLYYVDGNETYYRITGKKDGVVDPPRGGIDVKRPVLQYANGSVRNHSLKELREAGIDIKHSAPSPPPPPKK
jgi:hypothetical protein